VTLTDTSAAAEAIQLEIHRSMSGEQRLDLAFEMSMFARELNRARISREHPEWTEAQVARELLRLAFFPAPLPAGLR
jgi:Rv0078B-related antitoxin